MKLVYQAAFRVVAWLGRITAYIEEDLRVLLDLMENNQNHQGDRSEKRMVRVYLGDVFYRDYWRCI
jgi:hypothetical protein